MEINVKAEVLVFITWDYNSHMTSVAHSAGTCLRSTLIGSSLKDFIVALIVKSRCQCSELYVPEGQPGHRDPDEFALH